MSKTYERLMLVVGFITVGEWALSCACAAQSDDEWLQLVKKGCDLSYAQLKSAKGKATVYKWRRSGPGIGDSVAKVHSFLTSGKAFKTKVEPYGPFTIMPDGEDWDLAAGKRLDTEIIVCDGSVLTKWDKEAQLYTMGDKTTRLGMSMHEFSEVDVSKVGRLTLDISALTALGIKSTDFKLLRRETIEGDAYSIVERQVSSEKSGKTITQTYRCWVDMDKNFMCTRVEVWIDGGAFDSNTLIGAHNVELREYSKDVWLPARATTTQYMKYDGVMEKELVTVVKFDADCQVNVDVAACDLTLSIPSGSDVEDERVDARYTMP